MMGPVEELEAIRKELGDLPERLAAVLRRTEQGGGGRQRDSEGKFLPSGQQGDDKPGDPMGALRKFTSAGQGLPGGGMLKPFTEALDTYKRIKDMFDGLAELRQSLRDQASPPAAPLPWGEEQQKGFPAELKGDMPTPAAAPAPPAAPATSAGWPSGAAPLGAPPVGSPAAQPSPPAAAVPAGTVPTPAAPQPATGPATPLRMPPATQEPTDREREMMKALSDIEAQEWKDKIEEGRKTKLATAGPEGKLNVPEFRQPSQQEIDDFNNEVPVKPAGPSAGAGDSRTPSEILEDQKWEEGKAARAAARTPAGPGVGSAKQPGSTDEGGLLEVMADLGETIKQHLIPALKDMAARKAEPAAQGQAQAPPSASRAPMDIGQASQFSGTPMQTNLGPAMEAAAAAPPIPPVP